jgi:hypothetical protein
MPDDVIQSDLQKTLCEFVSLAKNLPKDPLLLKELFALAEKSGLDELKQLAEHMKVSESRKQLLQSWMVGYEKAIIGQHFHRAKQVTDDACFDAVEDFTQRMYDHSWIKTIRGKEFDTMEDAIQHHVNNLISAGLWKPGHEPYITQVDSEEQELIVNVPECQFLEGCTWATESEYFSPVYRFRCQRVGCFIGAVKKYLKDGKIQPDSTPDYFMTRIHEETGCSAIVFFRRGFVLRKLLSKYGMLKKENEK